MYTQKYFLLRTDLATRFKAICQSLTPKVTEKEQLALLVEKFCNDFDSPKKTTVKSGIVAKVAKNFDKK